MTDFFLKENFFYNSSIILSESNSVNFCFSMAINMNASSFGSESWLRSLDLIFFKKEKDLSHDTWVYGRVSIYLYAKNKLEYASQHKLYFCKML